MTSLALLFTLSALGISETVYLIKKRILLQKPVCPIGENCLAVLTSKYNKLFIIQNDLLGLLFYITCSVITALLVINVPPLFLWDIIIKVLIVCGTMLSVFFTYLQFRIIKAWCFWCLMSATTIWLMAIIILFANLY
ncbi:MAG: hypothetical protein UR31_C0035G0002 [Parcubacteria group bacterium GW2011_GWA2_33_14]|uniref:Vitamin K epoxide reductase domain-containing protein n=1 Tax=Candidatus Staskawiczbacteria bacterium RIFCSPHIGHO2_02_FULL_33_16 TaxID=1802204 RepID=A0A1G2HTE3_9BACT|nr:MAG: hypothetical protein UR31_C0035G0002 [Parcubacteria group bacterium GW2011_GWA2_33_14]OGZ65723.1 MAG: hypothetical protein A3D34_03450 [Candidatus Staskawiczbacteria bacterium RIFCSPHIGHO2_02_FULL_33_16]OGZ70286.1 MAG: hypothetical protein A2980_01940 [Candidatus Staskawiczbacteria bacterium RIFCSPLOWO2_01_FULL_33_13]